MSAQEQQKLWSISGPYLPTLKGLNDDAEALKKVPVARLCREAIDNARPRPISTCYSDMSLGMARQFNAALEGEVPVPQALEELEGELQNIANQG